MAYMEVPLQPRTLNPTPPFGGGSIKKKNNILGVSMGTINL